MATWNAETATGIGGGSRLCKAGGGGTIRGSSCHKLASMTTKRLAIKKARPSHVLTS